MTTTIRCPSCARALQLPESLVGQLVQCPRCQTNFTAQQEGITTEPMPLPPPEPKTYQPAEPPSEPVYPPPSSAPVPSFGGRDEDDYYPRQRFDHRSSRGAALQAVSGPASALQVVSGIQIALAALGLLGNLCMGMGGAGRPRPGRLGAGGGDPAVEFFGNVFVAFLVLILGCLVFYGAGKMKSLESYGWAITACILAMLPCSLCCILGLPFGIWGLIVINRSEVNNAFHAMSDHYR